MRLSVFLLVAFLMLLAVHAPVRAGVPPPSGADREAVRQATRERSDLEPTLVRVSGDWALADLVQEDREQHVRRRASLLLLQRTALGWKVTAEFPGGGLTTPEALEYHAVPAADLARLLPSADRDALKPVVAFLRKLMPERYPTGYLVENVARSGDWALCSFRHRASLKKPDTTGWILLRRTDDKWHLVERGSEVPDVDKYGVPRRVKKILRGEVEQP